MTIAFYIKDSLHGSYVEVSHNRELLVRTQFQTAEKITLTVDDTAVNILQPIAGEQAIITGIFVNTNRGYYEFSF